VGSQPVDDKPINFDVKQNIPNPCNGSTIIEIKIPNDSYVSLKVFDAIGREITTLAQGMYSHGTHRFRWNANGMASGVYYYNFNSGSFSKTRKIALIR
jgi:hypothetical protein